MQSNNEGEHDLRQLDDLETQIAVCLVISTHGLPDPLDFLWRTSEDKQAQNNEWAAKTYHQVAE